jgi:MSHA pilin protein MshA
MQKVQKGFTLIELVVVIVLLGILGVTALAKFQDLSTDAQTAANAGIAAEISSGASINYAASILGTGLEDISADNCATLAPKLLASGLPAGYTVAGGGCTAASSGTSVSCTVNGGSGSSNGIASVICN